MKITKQDFYHGAALKQIADHPSFTSINKISTKDGVYQVNDGIRILIKYSESEDYEWKFTFREDDLDELVDSDKSFVVLVCGGDTICLLDCYDINELIDLVDNDSQWVSVTYPDGGQMRVFGSQGDLTRLIPHNAFPKKIFIDLAVENDEYVWPPLSRITWYSEEPSLQIRRSTNRMLDLSDSLMSRYDERTVYFGLSTDSHLWQDWDDKNLQKIESKIREDLEFDGFSVEIDRYTTNHSEDYDKYCSQEFIWKLHIYTDEIEDLDDYESESRHDLESPEIRKYSPRFPLLVRGKKQEVCSIEFDIDNLELDESFKHGKWDKLIAKLISEWVEVNRFLDRGTIWSDSQQSTNFGHLGSSVFFAVLGMPDTFRDFLSEQLDNYFGQYVRVKSDYVIPDKYEGWNPRYHIEDGKAWRGSDEVTWEECRA